VSARARVAALCIAAVVLAACGGGDLPSMSGDAAKTLDEQVTAVRYAVQARDADAATRALDTLRASVERLRRSGDLTDKRASQILAAAGAVGSQLVSITTTTTTTTTLPPAPPTKPVKGHGKEDKGGNGQGQE
jgi:hypothetical protein